MALNTSQQKVYEWLSDSLGLPVFAEAYKGAVVLLSEQSAGYVSFVAHAGRDLMNGLAPAVAGIKPGRVQYEQHIEQIIGDWRDEWRYSSELLPEIVEKGHLIPARVCHKISSLIEDHKAGRERSADKIGLFFSTFLAYSDKDKVPQSFLAEWDSARKWFVGHAHLREKPFRAEVVGDLEKHFNCLDGYLYIAASSQYERLKALNEILDATNC